MELTIFLFDLLLFSISFCAIMTGISQAIIMLLTFKIKKENDND